MRGAAALPNSVVEILNKFKSFFGFCIVLFFCDIQFVLLLSVISLALIPCSQHRNTFIFVYGFNRLVLYYKQINILVIEKALFSISKKSAGLDPSSPPLPQQPRPT